MNLALNGEATGLEISEVGLKYADASAFPPSVEPSLADAVHFSTELDEMREQALALYEMVLNEVPV
ncbi:MAG: hypothetical protein IH820_14670 [Bacteroidetes bacterium]|nr:hypothetical protein [Bacteroidota bacterium]